MQKWLTKSDLIKISVVTSGAISTKYIYSQFKQVHTRDGISLKKPTITEFWQVAFAPWLRSTGSGKSRLYQSIDGYSRKNSFSNLQN